MVEKKIKAGQDFQFTNFSGTHFFTEGEVKRIQFISQRTFEEHLKSGWMVEARADEEEGKIIPVVYPPDMEDAIVSVDPVDGIEPDKPDLPCPPEIEEPGVEVPEDLCEELTIEEVVPEQKIADDRPEIAEIQEFEPVSGE